MAATLLEILFTHALGDRSLLQVTSRGSCDSRYNHNGLHSFLFILLVSSSIKEPFDRNEREFPQPSALPVNGIYMCINEPLNSHRTFLKTPGCVGKFRALQTVALSRKKAFPGLNGHVVVGMDITTDVACGCPVILFAKDWRLLETGSMFKTLRMRILCARIARDQDMYLPFQPNYCPWIIHRPRGNPQLHPGPQDLRMTRNRHHYLRHGLDRLRIWNILLI
jgi:hypothetical protein